MQRWQNTSASEWASPDADKFEQRQKIIEAAHSLSDDTAMLTIDSRGRQALVTKIDGYVASIDPLKGTVSPGVQTDEPMIAIDLSRITEIGLRIAMELMPNARLTGRAIESGSVAR